jgi:MFS family permease
MPNIPPYIRAALEALKFCSGHREALHTLNDSDWRNLLAFCDRMHLTIPLGRVCGNDLPDWVRSRIDRNISDNAERFERIKVNYLELASALRGVGAEHVVLKGFAQWPGYVEDPRFRVQSDIDLFCPPESILRARDAVSTLGYEPLRGLEHRQSDQLPPMLRKTGWEWRGNSYDPEMPVSLDLHSCFWDETTARFGPNGLDQFWFRRVERRLDNFSFPALNAADNLGYYALSALRDLVGCALLAHQVYELAWFLHTNADNELFWKNWRESHDDSLHYLETISFRLAFDWFAPRLPEEVEKSINCLPTAVQGWFQEYRESPLTAWFRPNKDGVWLHLSLLESFRDKRSVLCKRLFPTRIPPVERVDLPDIISKGGQTSRRRPLWRHVRYFAYLISRMAFHVRILPPTLWHGVRWWWSARNLGREFWTFLAACLLFDFGMFIFFFLYNLYLLDQGFKESFLGLVASALAVGRIAGSLPAGIVAQRFGLRKTLLLCFTLMSLVSVFRSLLALEAPLLVLAFLSGAVWTIWAVSISPAVAQLTKQQNRPLGFSMVFSSGIAVGILGGQAGGRLPGWLAHTGPLVAAGRAKQGALLIACGIIALATLPTCRLRFASIPVREGKFYPRNPFLLRFLPAVAVWSLATGAFVPFSNVYFSQYLRMPVERIGVIFSVSQLSQVLAMLVAPAVFRRFGLVTGIVYTQIVTAVALGCLAAVPGASAAAIVYAGYVAFQWMNEPGMYSLLMNEVAPSERSGASALNFLVISSAEAIAAAAAGASFVRFGYPAVLSATAGVALVAALLFRRLLGNITRPITSAAHVDL